jgi:hypothetical protein
MWPIGRHQEAWAIGDKFDQDADATAQILAVDVG